MKLYQGIITYGLIVAGGLGLLGCESRQKAPEPVYISGKVKNENFQNNMLNPDEYIFSVNTQHGLKIFKCSGNNSAPTLDALIDPGDEVKIKLGRYDEVEDTNFSISQSYVVEINGQQPPQ